MIVKNFPLVKSICRVVKTYFCLKIGLGGLFLFIPLLANFELGEKAFQSRVYNFAILNFEKALTEENDPDRKETARYRLAESYFYIEKWDNALKNIDDYLKAYPQGKWVFQIKYLQAQTYIKKKDYKSAKEIILALIDDDQDHSESYKLIFTLSQIYQDQGQYKDAVSVLKQEMGKYDQDRYYLIARIHYLNHNYQAGLEEIVKVKKEDLKIFSLDEGVDLHVEILLNIQNYQEALKVIEQFFYRLQNKEIKSKFLFYQSHISYLEGDYNKAIVQYKNYLDKVNSSPYLNDAVFFLALTYFDVDQPIIALDYLGRLENPEVEAGLSPSEKARKNKLAYVIYKKLNRQEKQSDYLSRLIVPGSPEELFGIKEKLEWMALRNDYTPPGKVTSEMEGYLSRYKVLEKSSQERAKFYEHLAETYFKNNNLELNIYFSRLAYLEDADTKYILGLGDRLIASQNYAQGIKVYESLLNKSEGKEKRYLHDALGFALFENGNYQRSADYYTFNLNAPEPSFRSAAWFYLGENYRLMQDYNESKKYFNGFLKIYPKDQKSALVYFNLGFINFYGDKDYRKSLKNLDQALVIIDSNKEAVNSTRDSDTSQVTDLRNNIYQFRFRCFLELGDEKKAEEELGRISRKDAPDLYYDNLLILAKFFFNRQDFSSSLNQYHAIINSENSDSRPSDEILEKAYFERILIKLKEDSGREAYFYLLKLKDRFPDSPLVREAFLSVGDHYYSMKQWKNSQKVYTDFDKYAQTPDDKIYALYYLGFTLEQMGKSSEAYHSFNAIKEIGKSKSLYNDLYYEALFELGIYDFDNKKIEEAKENFQEILKKSPSQDLKSKAKKNLDIIESINDPNPYAGLKTVKDIQKKIQKVSSQVLKEQGYYLIARIYFDSGNFEKAYEFLIKIGHPSRYWGDAVIVALHSLLSLKDFAEAYDYGMRNYFISDFNLAGDKREFFYYALAYASKKTGKRADYENFLQLLRKEFPNTEYLKNDE